MADELERVDVAGSEVFQRVRKSSVVRSPEQILFERAVSAAWLAHQRGFPIEPATIYEQDRTLSISVLSELVATPKFKNALEARGIPSCRRR